MSLLQTWYGLSDYEVEDRINDSISFSKFCGLTLEQSAPDHSTLSRFRSLMTEKKAYEKLLKELNKQLVKHKIIVKQGAVVDVSVIDTLLKPKGKVTYEVAQDREEPQISDQKQDQEKSQKRLSKAMKSGVDTQSKERKPTYEQSIKRSNKKFMLFLHIS